MILVLFELNHDSVVTAVRVYDIEPFTDHWDRELAFTNQVSSSHVRLVSYNLNIT